MKRPHLGNTWLAAFCTLFFGLAQDALRGQTENPQGFVERFRVARIRTYEDAKRFGLEFGATLKNDESLVLSVLAANSTDPRQRHAALTAAATAPNCGNTSRRLLLRHLYDSERPNREVAVDLASACAVADADLLDALIDVAAFDVAPSVRAAASSAYTEILGRFAQSAEAADRDRLVATLRSLDEQLPLVADIDARARMKGASGDVDRTIETVSQRVNSKTALQTAMSGRLSAANAPSTWLDREDAFRVAGLAVLTTTLGLGFLTNIYYLAVLYWRPDYLFRFLRSSYPAFVPRWLFRPDLFRWTIKPPIGFLKELQKRPHSKELITEIGGIELLATSLSHRQKDELGREIVECLRSKLPDRVKAQLFAALRAISQDLALAELDLAPEDPEIRQARKNMARLMDMPESGPTPGIQLAHELRQATTISADFYSVVARATDSYGIYMVDVDYHGLPASLDAMRVSFTLSAVRDWGVGRPKDELIRADELIRSVPGGGLSVTMNFLEVDLQSKKARYASAGMPPALLFKSGQAEPIRLAAVGKYVGDGYAFSQSEPAEAAEDIGAGDLLVLYSDGILEAHPRDHAHPFGEARLISAILSCRNEPVADIVTQLFARCEEYSARAKPLDDQSVIVIRISEDDELPSADIHQKRRNLRVSRNTNGMNMTANITKDGDWPEMVGLFLESHGKEFVWSIIKDDEVRRRFIVASQEACYNALQHGTDEGDVVTIELRPSPESRVEISITQPNSWKSWQEVLGARRQRQVEAAIARWRVDPSSDAPLGGATLIRLFADDVLCNGRRLTLTFGSRLGSEPETLQ